MILFWERRCDPGAWCAGGHDTPRVRYAGEHSSPYPCGSGGGREQTITPASAGLPYSDTMNARPLPQRGSGCG